LFVATKILIITQDAKFSINAKKSLERKGEFEVTAFTSATRALKFAIENPQALVVLDFRVRDTVATEVIAALRDKQPDVAIIAAPNLPTVQKLQAQYDIQAVIDIPYPMRKLVAVLKEALREMYDSQSDTAAAEPVVQDESSIMANYEQVLEFWVSDKNDGEASFEISEEINEPLRDPEQSSKVFEQLAAEEPPMPTFEDNSTIQDLHKSLVNPHNVRRIVEALEKNLLEDADTEEAPTFDDEESRSIPAYWILETALDQSTPIKTFSVQEFLKHVEERRLPDEPAISPLPSWVDESERYVREPDFLPDDLTEFSEVLEYTSTPTAPNDAQQFSQDVGALPTDPLEPVRRSHPIEAEELVEDSEPLVETEAAIDTPQTAFDEVQTDVFDAEESDTQYSDLGRQPAHAAEIEKAPPMMQMPYTEYDERNPKIAQMALTLTQVSLELTAEASLLAKAGRIVAYAGKLPREEIDALRAQLGGDWATAEQKSRIRFVTLPGSGADYMIYSRQTDGDFTLSMIFAGNLPLSFIRRQAGRLVDALGAASDEAVLEVDTQDAAQDTIAIEPDLPGTPVAGLIDATIERQALAFIWLLRDPNNALSANSIHALEQELNVQLANAQWRINTLNVQEDFICLFADVPLGIAPNAVIHDLLQLSATIVQKHQVFTDADNVWDDSYLVLRPGRELSVEEIQQFINFAR